jgi:hypothetical protein
LQQVPLAHTISSLTWKKQDKNGLLILPPAFMFSTDSRIGLRFFIGSCMSSRVTSEQGSRQILESAVLRSSRHRQLEVPGLRMSVTPSLHRIKIPELHTFANSRLHRFQASENREFPAPEKHVSRTSSNSTFRG